ncbi:hypothetical protein LCGC14_1649370 [marine sediment metagenome]|uniref:Uncharacterized protein n=1 Tax=marine sediment metagenome TaxID=412755 RepID=A0A0F9KD77_9ZZZZ
MAAGVTDRLVVVGPNEAARKGILAGRITFESVSIRYAHWSKCCCNRKVHVSARS